MEQRLDRSIELSFNHKPFCFDKSDRDREGDGHTDQVLVGTDTDLYTRTIRTPDNPLPPRGVHTDPAQEGPDTPPPSRHETRPVHDGRDGVRTD